MANPAPPATNSYCGYVFHPHVNVSVILTSEAAPHKRISEATVERIAHELLQRRTAEALDEEIHMRKMQRLRRLDLTQRISAACCPLPGAPPSAAPKSIYDY